MATNIRFIVFALASLLASAVQGGEPCGVSLKSLGTRAAAPGQAFEMYGRWGERQGKKIPSINKGGWNRLEVLAWSDSVLLVRIPEGLAPGRYKVGVYCNDLAEGGSYSSGWKNFRVEATDRPVADVTAPPRAGAPMAPPAVETGPPVPDREGLSINQLLLAVSTLLALVWWLGRR